MTSSIVDFEQHMKTTDRPTDVILNSLNRFTKAKETGALRDDELAKIEILIGRLYANLVRMGKKTEDDVEDFERQVPNGKYDAFNYPHKGLDVAHDYIVQADTAALYDRENRFGLTKKM